MDLTREEKEIIIAMMDVISDLPTSYESVQNRLDIDEEDFYESVDNLKKKLNLK